MNLIKISGLGRAIMHQQRAMELNGIEYTLDPKDSYDVVHINTLGLKSKFWTFQEVDMQLLPQG